MFFSILLSGHVAGLFYAYSCSVNPGLHMLDNNEYVHAMQSINTAIQNPLFFISFMGLLIVYPLSCYQLYSTAINAAFYYMLAATIIYFVGVFGVTAGFNIPLNNKLAQFKLSSATVEEIASMRKLFESPWNTYHGIRTFAAVLSFALSIISLFKIKQ